MITPQITKPPVSRTQQQQANERERIKPVDPKQAPAPPGMGKFVDKEA